MAWPPIPGSVRTIVIHIFEQSVLGIKVFHDGRRLTSFLVLIGVIWCIDACGTVMGASALGLSRAFPLAFLLIAGLGLGSALPSTPGYVGIFQFVAVSVLVPLGFSRMSGGIGFWRYQTERKTRP